MPVWHGTNSTYVQGCRCADCREAHRVVGVEARQSRSARAAADPRLIPHGTLGGYNTWGCRCDDCREALRLHRRAGSDA